MISKEEILNLIADIESDRVERTISTSDTNKFCEAICAFSNDLPNHNTPGYLIIGLKDNGDFSGLNVTDELLKNLMQRIETHDNEIFILEDLSTLLER